MTEHVVWSILIATLPERALYLARILERLNNTNPLVEILIAPQDRDTRLDLKRQALVEQAQGYFVSFVDDDDLVAADYIERIFPLLTDEIDYVGFKVQAYNQGVPYKPTIHHLSCDGWYEDEARFFRDISHLNPIRRTIALLGSFIGKYGEDKKWSDSIRFMKPKMRQAYINEFMYFYFFDPNSSATHHQSPGARHAVSWNAQVIEWSSPPVDDVGYIKSEDLLAMPYEEFKATMLQAYLTRVAIDGWRNHEGRWYDLLLDNVRGSTVIDYGSGIGIDLAAFAHGGAAGIRFADISQANLYVADRTLKALGGMSGNFSLIEPGGRTNFESSFADIFHCSGVMHHTPDALDVMTEAARLLKPGGQARFMLYSDLGWMMATGMDHAPMNMAAHPREFKLFVRKFDQVGNYAEWYDKAKITVLMAQCGIRLTHFEYITPDQRYCVALGTKEPA